MCVFFFFLEGGACSFGMQGLGFRVGSVGLRGVWGFEALWYFFSATLDPWPFLGFIGFLIIRQVKF